MKLSDRLRARREEFGEGADAMFEQAWSGVRVLAQPFKYELDLLRAPSGEWRDLFANAPCRVLDLPVLLMEDLGAPEGDARDRRRWQRVV